MKKIYKKHGIVILFIITLIMLTACNGNENTSDITDELVVSDSTVITTEKTETTEFIDEAEEKYEKIDYVEGATFDVRKEDLDKCFINKYVMEEDLGDSSLLYSNVRSFVLYNSKIQYSYRSEYYFEINEGYTEDDFEKISIYDEESFAQFIRKDYRNVIDLDNIKIIEKDGYTQYEADVRFEFDISDDWNFDTDSFYGFCIVVQKENQYRTFCVAAADGYVPEDEVKHIKDSFVACDNQFRVMDEQAKTEQLTFTFNNFILEGSFPLFLLLNSDEMYDAYNNYYQTYIDISETQGISENDVESFVREYLHIDNYEKHYDINSIKTITGADGREWTRYNCIYDNKDADMYCTFVDDRLLYILFSTWDISSFEQASDLVEEAVKSIRISNINGE